MDSTLNSANIAKGHVLYEEDAPMVAVDVCMVSLGVKMADESNSV